MNRFIVLAMIPIGILSDLNAEAPRELGKYNFGGGLNLATIPTEIADNESPDMCNCINDRYGGLYKRNGSKRYISQAVSSFPVSSLYRSYGSTGTLIKKTLLMSSGSRIYASTKNADFAWIVVSSNLALGQHWRWVTMNNTAIGTGDLLYDDVKIFDPIKASTLSNLFVHDNGSDTVIIKAKYPIVSKNYLILGNVVLTSTPASLTPGSTYYPNRIYYSLLTKPSCMTATRYIEIRSDDGDQISGIGNMFDKTDVFKSQSIYELDFTILNLPSAGGDWRLSEIVSGFGVYSDRSLVNTGQFYIFASLDGIRKWDGGRRSRLTIAEESRIISEPIRPLIDKLIKAGTYKNVVGKYYKAKEWYILSYEHPDKFPEGVNNSVLIYDIRKDQWFPFCNWTVSSMETFDGVGDNGELLLGNSADGYVDYGDIDIRPDDTPKEIVLDTMDSSYTWRGSTQNVNEVVEGTASLKISVDSINRISSMTKMAVFNVGEWYDKTKVIKENADLSFKVYPFNISSITNLRIDLEVDDEDNEFDLNFTSITISSASLPNGNTSWSTVKIALSSFPLRPDWTDLAIESVPFSGNLTYYGVRFVLSGVNISSVSVDDLRIVQRTDNPLLAYRFTPLYDFGTIEEKYPGQVVLTREKSPDASIYMDIYNDFGKRIRTEQFEAEIQKELIAFGFNGSTSNISFLDSVDFRVLKSTTSVEEHWFAEDGIANKTHVFAYDRTNDREFKISRSSIAVFVSTYGAFGSGSTNYNLVHQQALDEDGNVFQADMDNHRFKQHSQNDLSFLRQHGSLGNSATSYHSPSGIKAAEDEVIVSDPGNSRIVKLNKSTFGVLVEAKIDLNTDPDMTLEVDSERVYVAYNKINENNISFQEVILEIRDRGDLSLLNRIKIYPENDVSLSTYALLGNLGQLGKYIIISFTNDDSNSSASRYYIQKRLKSNGDLVKEYKSDKFHYSVIGDGLGYKPQTKTERKDLKVSGRYLQIKYYDKNLDNNWKLYNQTFLVQPKKVTY